MTKETFAVNDGHNSYVNEALAMMDSTDIDDGSTTTSFMVAQIQKMVLVSSAAMVVKSVIDSEFENAEQVREMQTQINATFETAMAKVLDVDDYNDQSSEDVNNSHEWDESFCNSSDSLDAAEEYDGNEDHDDNTDHNAGYRNCLSEKNYSACLNIAAECVDAGVDRGSDRIDLCHVTDTESSESSEYAEQAAEPFPALAEAVLDVVHRAAYPVAFDVLLTIVNCEKYLGVLCAHSENSGEPHPEYSTRAACEDSACNTGDITGTYSGRQRCGYSLERSYLTFSSILLLENLTKCVLHGESKPCELDESHADTKIDTAANQKNEHYRSPDETVNGIIDLHKFFHKHLLMFSLPITIVLTI
jgi:hypothetical protein